jgi:exosortase
MTLQEDRHNPHRSAEPLAEGLCDDGIIRAADRIWKIVLVSVLFVLLFRQELQRLVLSWGTASESHGILIPAFSLYFIYQVREQLKKTVGQRSYIGLLVMTVSLLGYVFSIYTKFGYPKPVMMIVMLGGIVFLLGGWPIFRMVWLPVFFLVFALKLPGGLHERITMPMRELASFAAAMILNLLPGLDCEASNVLIHGMYKGQPFDLNVAEACSGMRLLRTFVALGVAMAWLEYRPIVHRIILLVSTVPIAVFCNMLRVLLTGLIYIFIGPQWAQGTMHALLGMVMLLVAFGLYGGIAWIMNNLFVEEDDEKDEVLVIKQA